MRLSPSSSTKKNVVDPEAIKQALANLMDNAIKYSGEGRRLAVAVRAEGGWVAIEVADEGIGIPAGETERIFEKFYRIGRSETQSSRGSGVGLALVKHIAEAHGGRVKVESRPGEGSCFTLYLPVVMLVNRARYGLFPAQGDVIPTGPNFVTKDNAAQAIALSRRAIR